MGAGWAQALLLATIIPNHWAAATIPDLCIVSLSLHAVKLSKFISPNCPTRYSGRRLHRLDEPLAKRSSLATRSLALRIMALQVIPNRLSDRLPIEARWNKSHDKCRLANNDLPSRIFHSKRGRKTCASIALISMVVSSCLQPPLTGADLVDY